TPGKRADEINLSPSTGIVIQGNEIGTNEQGNNDPTQQDYGNAGDGIFVSQSNNITIGDPAAATAGALTSRGNIISGNHADGIFVSGGGATSLAQGNTIGGNYIGLDATGTAAITNYVAGLILCNAANESQLQGNPISQNTHS